MTDSETQSGAAERTDSGELRFQDAIAQVEAITERIERGEIGLEDSIDQFEKGMIMLARCREILARTEQRVEDITERLRGTESRSNGDSTASHNQDATR